MLDLTLAKCSIFFGLNLKCTRSDKVNPKPCGRFNRGVSQAHYQNQSNWIIQALILMALHITNAQKTSNGTISSGSIDSDPHLVIHCGKQQLGARALVPPVVTPQSHNVQNMKVGHGIDVGPFILHEEPKLICCSKCDNRTNPLRVSDLKYHIQQFHSHKGVPDKEFEDGLVQLMVKIGNNEGYQTIPAIHGPIRALRGLKINAEGIKCGGCPWARSRSSLGRALQHARTAHERPYEVVQNVKVQVGRRGEHGSFLVYESDVELDKLREKRPARQSEPHLDQVGSSQSGSEEEEARSVTASPRSTASPTKPRKRPRLLASSQTRTTLNSALPLEDAPEMQLTPAKQNLLLIYANTLSDNAKLLNATSTEHHRCFVRSLCALIVQEAAWQLQFTRMAPFMASAARSVAADPALFDNIVQGVIDVLQNPREFGS